MQDNYASFLDYRAAQRQVAARFAHPRLLLVHVIAFVVSLTAVWAYGTGARLWNHYDNMILPTLIWGAWSLLLAGHAVRHFRRSAAMHTQRERAVEDEMREFIAKNRDVVDSDTLFDMHHTLENRLEREGRWSVALTAFALVNAISWTISLTNPTSSWPFQTTLPFALMIVGGVQAYMIWQQQRAAGRTTWFTRLPLWHIFAYPVGVIVLWALGAYRAINSWDADTLIQLWSLIVLAYVVWCVVFRPPLLALRARFTDTPPQDKRKLGRDVALGQDGELVEIADGDEVVEIAGLDASAYADEAAQGSTTHR